MVVNVTEDAVVVGRGVDYNGRYNAVNELLLVSARIQIMVLEKQRDNGRRMCVNPYPEENIYNARLEKQYEYFLRL